MAWSKQQHREYSKEYMKNPVKRLAALWRGMHRRCQVRASYSGREICSEWTDRESFIDWALENGYQIGMTLDRIDNQRGYSPQNCQWLTKEDHGRKSIIDTDSRGSRHGMSKLTESDVRLILESSDTVINLSAQFGVTETTIYKILRGESWTHVRADSRRV